ncbi:PcfJ domain-containing protein [Vibrio rotiferianus]|uniref:PcfJ domain-containing protein n=1 Tax=Vibrio rotiferianus TaxID=190895 RepID=UPI0038B3D728
MFSTSVVGDELVAMHDRWTEQRILKFNIRPKDAGTAYPELFHCSDERLVPIRNYDQLLQESADQKHCIVSYHSWMAMGAYAAFKVEAPERVTIGGRVVGEDKPRFEVDQIKCQRNKEPAEATRKLIYELIGKLKSITK